MCAILGIFNTHVEMELAKKCIDTMAHRGPDGYGLVREDNNILGHRRLAILDLSDAGKQPMYYENRYVISFNGEIYNFVELREELKLKGYRFVTDTDTEVIVAAYIEWGVECQYKFNGMWSLAIYDRKEKRTFISRDRFGVKPLVYTYLNAEKTEIAIASEMKALFPLMKDVRPNKSIVCDDSRIMTYETGEECLVENIFHFPMGSYGFITDKGMEIIRYWDTLEHIPEVPEMYDEQVEMFRELFLDACRIRMRSDVTIGTALSGGLDSSATICAMKYLADHNMENRVNKDWQHAYVASFPGTTQDETEFSRIVTDYLGIQSTEVIIDPSEAVKHFLDYVWMFEEIYNTSPIPMMDLYGAVKNNGTTVTIDGHGADELFGGYTFDFINALDDARDKKEKNIILTAYIDSFPKNNTVTSLKSTSSAKVFFDYKKNKVIEALRAKLRGGDCTQVKQFRNSAFNNFDSLNKRLYISSHETILPTLMRNYDHYSMANGVEIRMPFMDYRIVTFAFAIDFRSKLHGGFSKSIVRDAMAPYMPPSIAYRKTKIGFNTPIVEWMKGPMRDFFVDSVNSLSFMNCDLIDPIKTKQKIMKLITDPKADHWEGLGAFSAIYPYFWEQAVIKGGSII